MSADKTRRTNSDNTKAVKAKKYYNEITLCLGVFILLLTKCTRAGVTQCNLVLALLRTISTDKYLENKKVDELNEITSKIANCKLNIPVDKNKDSEKKKADADTNEDVDINVAALARKMSVDDLMGRFDTVINLIDNDKRRSLIGALYEIIKKDNALKNDHQELFSQCMGGTIDDVTKKHRINLAKFLAGILLYTVILNDNKRGTSVITKIKKWDIDAAFSDFDIVFNQNILVQTSSETDSEWKYPDGLANYMKRLPNEYDYIPTLLNNKEPFKPFRAYYVQNNVVMRVREATAIIEQDGRYRNMLRDIEIENVTLDQILGASHRIVFKGDGGLGKSMMMRNLLLSCVDSYERLGLIPFFITLKDYSSEYTSIPDYICDMIHSMWPEVTIENIRMILKRGIALLLFDGLDEMSNDLLVDFTKKLNNFMTEYSENYYIISSRPYSNFSSIHNFSLVRLLEFTKKQALELIDRYNYFSGQPKVQKRFRDLVDTKLFYTHKNFSTNPLLLSIMMMTYRRDAEIPTEKYRFYERAYAVVSSEHDANKDLYKRQLSTGLNADQFAACFSYFCAATYVDSKHSFTLLEISNYLRRFKEKVEAGIIKDIKMSDIEKLTVQNFIYDAANNLCLMHHDEINYAFIHRSFQEYFCARYFHSLVDEDLENLIPIFNNNDFRKDDDLTLSMLFDMKPAATEKYVFIPYLKELFEQCEQDDGIWTFLRAVYPCYQVGDENVDVENVYCTPNSNLYSFMHDYYKIPELEVDIKEFPDAEYLIYEELRSVIKTGEIVSSSTLHDYFLGSFDFSLEAEGYDPEAEFEEYKEAYTELYGYIYEFNWRKITMENYEKLIEAVEDKNKPFMKEYMAMKDLLAELQEKLNRSDKKSKLEKIL